MTAHVMPQIYSRLSLTALTRHNPTVAVDTNGSDTTGALRGARRSSVANVAAHPISCVSSGHVRARDVEAARRHYLDDV